MVRFSFLRMAAISRGRRGIRMSMATLPAQAGPVRVGVIAELTGDMPAVGASCRNAAAAAVLLK